MRFTCVQYVCICRSMTSFQCHPSLTASLAPPALTSLQEIHIWFHHTRNFIIQMLPQLPSVLFKMSSSPATTLRLVLSSAKWYNKEGYLAWALGYISVSVWTSSWRRVLYSKPIRLHIFFPYVSTRGYVLIRRAGHRRRSRSSSSLHSIAGHLPSARSQKIH